MREDVGQRRSCADNGVAAEVLTFRGWTLELGGRSLTDPSGRDVRLTPAEFKLLAALARRPGSVLSRDQLLDAVAGRASAPFDRAIDVLVGRLRKKIEVDRKSPRIIVTVTGFGYKLVARPDRMANSIATLPVSRLPECSRRAMAVLVLPFTCGEPDRPQAAAAAIISEDLLVNLARSGDRPVVAGSVAARENARTIGLRQVGREFGVRYIVSGGVQRLGAILRIGAHLSDAVSGAHLWTERVTVDRKEVTEKLDVIVGRVARALVRQLTISDGMCAELAGETDPAALLARGRALVLATHSRDAARAARRCYEQALTIDGGSLEVMAALGARLAANLADRWSSDRPGDAAYADSLLRRVLLSAPDNALAHRGSGILLRGQGRHAESVAALQRATDIDPADPDANRQLGISYIYFGRPADGLRWIERSIDLDPRMPCTDVAMWALGTCFQLLGQPSAALDWLFKARAANPELTYVRVRLAGLFGMNGEIDEARRELRAAQAAGDFATLAELSDTPQSSHPDYRAMCEPTLYAGLRRAGIAEH